MESPDSRKPMSPEQRRRMKSRSRDKLNKSPLPTLAGDGLKSTFKPPENWVDAPEFVPRWMTGGNTSITSEGSGSSQNSESPESGEKIEEVKPRSYADVVGHEHATDSNFPGTANGGNYWEEWCPYHIVGECRFGEQCLMVHGVKCDYCGEFCLHPFDTIQRDKHLKDCVAEHEKDMELSFAVARSIEKTCGICYEKVLSKEPSSEQRFGILPSCNHCYCLSCIRRWRQARQFENKIIRACPECRVTSDFVCPSRYWVDSKEDKDKLIGCYKIALSQKNCRYYRNGEGQCPFGNKCFYRHALPNGQAVDVGPPRRIMGAEGRVTGGHPNVNLFEFIEEWEVNWMNIEELIDILDLEDLDIVDDTFDYWM